MLEIAAINWSLPTFEYISYMEDRTLRDFDIILFNPAFPYLDRIPFTAGGSCISIEDGKELIEARKHWNLEIKEALKAGKTVFIVAEKPKSDTLAVSAESKRKGERTYSTVNIFNYDVVPVELKPRAATGKKVIVKGDLFKNIIEILRDIVEYRAIFDADFQKDCQICAKDGAPIGGLITFADIAGSLVVLPFFEFGEQFVERDEKGLAEWKSSAFKLSKAIETQVVAIDKMLRAGNIAAPPPEWVAMERLPNVVVRLGEEASAIEATISEMQLELDEKRAKIAETSRIQNLLFGTGKPLEVAIESCLNAMGFDVSTYRAGDVEIDHVVVSPEGFRLIGESEGKDSSAIDIKKFRQLESNIGEDFERDEIEIPAIGVLFGNGYRLLPPSERPAQFTAKSLTNAKRLGCALVQTCDLYHPARYLIDNPNDDEYKKKCRDAIIGSSGGVVVFPPPP